MLEDAAAIRKVVIACGYVDLRKGIDGLILCQEKVQIKNDFFPSCQHT